MYLSTAQHTQLDRINKLMSESHAVIDTAKGIQNEYRQWEQEARMKSDNIYLFRRLPESYTLPVVFHIISEDPSRDFRST